MDPTTGQPKDNVQPEDMTNKAPENKGAGFVTGNKVAEAIQKSGFTIGKQDNVAELKFENKDEKVNPNDHVRFADGANTKVRLDTQKKLDENSEVVTTTTIQAKVVGLPISYTTTDGKPITKVGDNYYLTNKDGYPVGNPIPANQLTTNLVNPSVKGDQIGAATQLGNVAAGTETLAGPIDENGVALVKVGDKFYNAGDINNQGQPNANAKPINVKANTVNAYAGLADLSKSKPTNAITVADAKKLGWVVSASDNDYADDVRNANQVDFTSGNDLAKVEGRTRANGIREIKVTVSKDPTFNTVQVGGSTGPKLSADGDTLKVAKADGSPVRITNVAAGKNPNDAVNVSQLKQTNAAVNHLGDRIDAVDKNLRAGIAGSLAAASIYHATIPGKSMISAGAGTYFGQSAVAVGYSRLSDNGKVGVKVLLNANSRGKTGAAAAIGYQF
ncbi:YadA-like family protein [Pasteurellaceae bacterium 22721_9_1]